MKLGEVEFKPETRKEGWYFADAGGDLDKIEGLARDLSGTLEGYFTVCGWLDGDEYHRLYLVPAGDLAEVTEGFATEMSQVMLRKVDQLVGVVPYYADPRGFQFLFKKKVDRDLGEKILACLQTLAVVAMCQEEIFGDCEFDEDCDHDVGEDGSEEAIVDFIVKNQRVELRWDLGF